MPLVVGFMGDSCVVDNFTITNEISSYEKSLDPELCENILEKLIPMMICAFPK